MSVCRIKIKYIKAMKKIYELYYIQLYIYIFYVFDFILKPKLETTIFPDSREGESREWESPRSRDKVNDVITDVAILFTK